MSIRAYKLIEIKTEREPTFNVGVHNNIFNLANSEQFVNGGGILTFEKDILLEALVNCELGKEEAKIAEQIRKEIGKNNNTIDYYCY